MEETHAKATAALEKIGEMVGEVEETNRDKIEILELTVDGLANKIDELLHEKTVLIEEACEARRSFTGLQIAVSILLFAYGMFYGTYFGKCM